MSLEKEELYGLDLDADPSSQKKIIFVDRILLQKVCVQGCFYFVNLVINTVVYFDSSNKFSSHANTGSSSKRMY